VLKIAIAPNGKWVASTCASNLLKLWDPETAKEHFSVVLGDAVRQMFFNADGSRLLLFTGKEATRVMIFDVKA